MHGFATRMATRDRAGNGVKWGARWPGVALLAALLLVGLGPATASALEALSSTGGLLLRVEKEARRMWLEQGGRPLRQFPIVLGSDPRGGKLHRGDGRTPEGRYYVCDKKPKSRFRRFLGISYPGIGDAERALQKNLIDPQQWSDILFANFLDAMPPQDTVLGGRVGIHGFGDREEMPIDWTQGCIAVSNADIDYLFDVIPVGTPIEIRK